MSLRFLRNWLVAEADASHLRGYLADIAHEIGGDYRAPETVLQAAQGLRDSLNRALGHQGTPRHADGHSVAFTEVGR